MMMMMEEMMTMMIMDKTEMKEKAVMEEERAIQMNLTIA
jgi:hypothetical protein